MFDFDKWRERLRGRADELEAEGFPVTFKIRDEYVRAMCVEIQSNTVAAVFSNWESGFADYDFFDIRTGQATMKAAIPVDDKNFESTFAEFVKRFREMK